MRIGALSSTAGAFAKSRGGRVTPDTSWPSDEVGIAELARTGPMFPRGCRTLKLFVYGSRVVRNDLDTDMLISHRKKFIYLKTKKTASTSVEVYFEPFCEPEGQWEFSHLRDEYVGPAGIVGARGPAAQDAKWYNHMPASEIRQKIGEQIWNEYLKFTTIRNPFDKIVSYFHHTDYGYRDQTIGDCSSLKEMIETLAWPLRAPEQLEPQERFKRWAQLEQWLDRIPMYSGFVNDRDKYVLDGESCIDYFVEFEQLHRDIEVLCDKLDIPYEPERMPELKSGRRPEGLKYDSYYDQKTADIIADKYAMEIEKFDYAYPTAANA